MNVHTKAKGRIGQTPSTHQIRVYSMEPVQRLTASQKAKLEELARKETARHSPQRSALPEIEEPEELCP